MKNISQLFRLIEINFILAKYGLDNIILSLRLFSPIRFFVYLNPWNWFRRGQFSRGVAIRHALEDLGPIFVKFGQALSTREDLFPDDVIAELAKLQDKVPPFSSELAKTIVEKAYGRPISELFQSFDEQPLASASIAQVHSAQLNDGQHVVIKILRPKMHKIIQQDISLLYTVAKFAEKYWSEGKRLKPLAIIAEFEKNIFAELNLLREAGNASQLRRNFERSDKLYVPKIYWPYAQKEIIVMERIYGIPIADVDRLKASGFNMKKVAECAVEIFFAQVFRDNFFHADLHPGNLFIKEKDPDNPQFIAIDFGLMGILTENDKRYLVENMLAFFNRDYRLAAKLHIDSGWVPQNTRLDEFEAAIRSVCEPIFERPLKEISFAQIMAQLFQCVREFNMEVQPQLITLQKTLFSVEGLVRQLYPELDLWTTAQPYFKKAVAEQRGPKLFIHKFREHSSFWLEQAPEIPALLHDVLKKFKQQQVTLEVKPLTTRIAMKAAKQFRRGFSYGLGVALVLIAAVNFFFRSDYLVHSTQPENLTIGFAIGGLLLLLITWLNK